MRKWLIGLLILLAVYIGYPYLTLYWLDRALLSGDTQALASLVDFPQVRQTLKADVKLALIEQAQTQAGQGKILGIFGAALAALLVPTLVDSVVDETVTPEKIINSEEVKKRREEQKSFIDFVTYAFFESPTEFRLDLKDPGDKDSPTMTALMELTGLRWRVVAVKLPPVDTWFSKQAADGPPNPAPPQ